ncbi:hypothetical protein D8S82_32380 [Mycobacterium hodleri]|uniref:PRC-barrel domain-containing protein n=1 Tax=Mycolicibacterium hodleri TaxID=49897 RepID=A0A544VQX7_9MYCO|nr:hypothetical protein [Mycolicibacterium hodleri]TQR82388.1 hypothetical protein D8S82_32380 [Mycolicibacterium hodleri]
MQLSELLGLNVHDATARHLGTVIDVRLSLGAHSIDERPAAPRLLGLLISPRTQSSYLGYERSDARRPLVLATLLRWRHRGTFLAAWDDIHTINSDLVQLRSEYTRYSPLLRNERSHHP